MHLRPGPADPEMIAIVPANEASWEDLAAIFGVRGYPMITEPGQEVTWGETHVGTRSIFEAAGFAEVARATLRRVVMRIDF